jgi:hypothetical protein
MTVAAIFVLDTPCGIFLSMLMMGSFASVEGIVLALSAGTSTSLSEIVVEEFSVSHHKYSKFAFFVGGVVLVSILIGLFEV